MHSETSVDKQAAIAGFTGFGLIIEVSTTNTGYTRGAHAILLDCPIAHLFSRPLWTSKAEFDQSSQAKVDHCSYSKSTAIVQDSFQIETFSP